MTVLTWVHDALDWASVVAPLLFLITYTTLHKWWWNTYARCLSLLAVALIFGRARDALVMFDGTRLERHVLLSAPSRMPWLHLASYITATAALGIAAVTFTVLAWKLIRPHLPHLHPPREGYLDKLLAEEAKRPRRPSH